MDEIFYWFLGSYCGQIQDETTVLNVGNEETRIVFKTDPIDSDRGFNLTYFYNDCGGVLHGPYHQISSSQANQDCVWFLDYPEGQQILLSQFNLNMDNSPRYIVQLQPKMFTINCEHCEHFWFQK